MIGLEKPKNFEIRATLQDYEDYFLVHEKRVLLYYGEIGQITEDDCGLGSSNVDWIVKKLEYLSELSKEPVKIILNSVGGDVFAGFLLYDTIINVRNKGVKVIIEVRGLAASTAAMIVLQAASERVATQHTRFLLHEVATIAIGKTTEVEEQAEELKKVNDMLRDILAEKTGKTKEEIENAIRKKDFWLSAEEAKKFGLIDKIIKLKRNAK